MTDKVSTAHGHATLPALTSFGKVKSRGFFTKFHLQSAKLAIESTIALEKQFRNNPTKQEDIKTNYIAYSSTAISAVVAALESNINELFIGFRENHKIQTNYSHSKIISNAISVFCGEDPFNTIVKKSKPALVKYNFYSTLVAKNDTITAKEEMNLKFIIEIRNNLIHFMPEWDDDLRNHKSLKNQYKNQFLTKFQLSSLYPAGSTFFPYLLVNASCATWCLDIIEDFISEYNSRVR